MFPFQSEGSSWCSVGRSGQAGPRRAITIVSLLILIAILALTTACGSAGQVLKEAAPMADEVFAIGVRQLDEVARAAEVAAQRSGALDDIAATGVRLVDSIPLAAAATLVKEETPALTSFARAVSGSTTAIESALSQLSPEQKQGLAMLTANASCLLIAEKLTHEQISREELAAALAPSLAGLVLGDDAGKVSGLVADGVLKSMEAAERELGYDPDTQMSVKEFCGRLMNGGRP